MFYSIILIILYATTIQSYALIKSKVLERTLFANDPEK
jgi:hypothetical protein